ncbi:MAG TPA: hypothetical protein VFY30_10250 [Solirubrobacterales bacterium]|nr:hypothetical protein [Solirubrobacterales bacterium]
MMSELAIDLAQRATSTARESARSSTFVGEVLAAVSMSDSGPIDAEVDSALRAVG